MHGPTLSEAYNTAFLEQQYEAFLNDPKSVSDDLYWFFSGAESFGNGFLSPGADASGSPQPLLAPRPLSMLNVETRLQTAAVRLINSFRLSGHLCASSNPIETPPAMIQELDPQRHSVEEADLDQMVDATMLFGSHDRITIRELLALLRQIYCGTVGVEYMHIQDFNARSWLAKQVEGAQQVATTAPEQQVRTLHVLRRAELFENFLQMKFVNKKRFGLEGGETLMPVLDAIVQTAATLDVAEIVVGMAHRGRLNVLTNMMNLPYPELFEKFIDPYHPDAAEHDGDVKYHLGRSDDVMTTSGKTLHISLTPNPSHLEAVNPVVEGRVRAKQRLQNDTERKKGLPLLIHGDAAFAGQGLVAETLSMANLLGYRTGGTIHVVVNNQIGFTTHPRHARSTQYCTDLAKFIHAPIFHVNAEDPDACVRIAELATRYRHMFASDVVIDVLCYRKMGHNETDDASVTQPYETKVISDKYIEQRTIVPIYTMKLLDAGVVKEDDVEKFDTDFLNKLEEAYATADKAAKSVVAEHKPLKPAMPAFANVWAGLTSKYSHEPADTRVSGEMIDRLADALVNIPANFKMHPKLGDAIIDPKTNEPRYPSNDSPYRRQKLLKTRGDIDWGTAEAMAFGSLCLEKHHVRLSGQDSRRATFSFRHAFYTTNTGTASEGYCPLANLGADAAPFDVFDSFLSEAAVLGFEYGYSLDDPNSLVLWEAQFGDFVNGAQVIIDQFIASGEQKWNRSSGLVLLLPHGYEGQGPEHSSARPERFLQLCAEDNMQVCTFTTPAQYFHALRRQVKRNFRKPLIVMTPKSYLRSSTSPVDELINGRFHEVLDDASIKNPSAVKRVLMCTGKVYFDLVKARTEQNRTDDVAIIRVEQLYPWPAEQLAAVLGKYPADAERGWVQEESENNGAWHFVEPRLRKMKYVTEYCGRDASASPAVGSEKMHKYEQEQLVLAAMTKPLPYIVE
jgi:2-oxoglutarate dehydrogenase E1 component